MNTGILGHAEIAELLDTGVVEGGQYSNINPASLNVTLGDTFLAEMRHPHNHAGFHHICDFSKRAEHGMTPQFSTFKGLIILDPRAFCLASIKEKLNLPANMCATFYLRSSAARMGLDANLAMFADPGYSGHLTLELSNILRYHAISLHAGDSIGQLLFHRMGKEVHADKTYRGNYQGDVGPQGARGYHDKG